MIYHKPTSKDEILLSVDSIFILYMVYLGGTDTILRLAFLNMTSVFSLRLAGYYHG